jgi:tetratricopeptide (TPR) repeat protein
MIKKTINVLFILGSIGIFLGGLKPAAGQGMTPYQESIAQADRLFQNKNYRNAVERYFFASQAAKERLDYARAYLGLTQSYFYLKDLAAAEKWAKMLLEVDPRRNVSVPAYPISFVQFFERVRNDFFKGSPPPPEEVTAPLTDKAATPAGPAPAKAEPSVKVEPRTQTQPASQTPAPAPASPPPPLTMLQPASVTAPEIRKGGNVQVQFHLSGWTLDPVVKIVEGLLAEKIGHEILHKVSQEVRSSHYALIEAGSQQELSFDSGGSNYGLEIRYYSRGWPGSFSLGLSFDQTTIRLALSGRVNQSFTNGTSAEAEASGQLTLDLASTLINFRWDISPLSRLSPYFIVGLGITPFEGVVNYEYIGTYKSLGLQEALSDGDEMTLKELAEENDFDLLDVFVVLQLAVGLDVEIYKGLTVSGEAGLWDGFYLRGGLGYRF